MKTTTCLVLLLLCFIEYGFTKPCRHDHDRRRRHGDDHESKNWDHDCSRDNDGDDDDDDDDGDGGISSGAMIGIITGCVVLIVLLVVFIIIARRCYGMGKNKTRGVARSMPNIYAVPFSSMPASNLSAPTPQATPPRQFESNQWTIPYPPPYPGHELDGGSRDPATTDLARGVKFEKQEPPPPYPAHEVNSQMEVSAPPLESETPMYDEPRKT